MTSTSVTLIPYAYRLTKMKGGSDGYGLCEVCRKAVDSVYLLTQMRRFKRHDGAEGLAEASSWFGHHDCLSQQTTARGAAVCHEGVFDFQTESGWLADPRTWRQ